MSRDESDRIRGTLNTPASTAATREIHGVGAAYLLASNEEELCEYLVTKYQNQFPLDDERRQEFQLDYRLLANAIRQNVVKRKSNFFSRATNSPDTQMNKKVA
jgi:hypothetical protein